MLDIQFEDFLKAYLKGTSQILSVSLFADTFTPISIFLKLTRNKSYPFLLESAAGSEKFGRYSIIGHSPDLIWQSQNDSAFLCHTIEPVKLGEVLNFEKLKLKPLESLTKLVELASVQLPDDMPAMAAGLVGYFGYDSIRMIEDIGQHNPTKLGLPDGMFVRPTFTAVFDNFKNIIHINAIIHPYTRYYLFEKHSTKQPQKIESKHDVQTALARQAWNVALNALDTAQIRLKESLPSSDPISHQNTQAHFTSNVTRDQFHDMVHKAKEYIHAGDIFQVVLSQKFSASYPGDPFHYYRNLRNLNPSPFLFFLDFATFQLCGSSPEILVRVRQDEITIRPIAGTRPRGKNDDEDHQYEQDLLNDPKERSEHLMLLDLGRNDAGRCAEIGSVHVDESFTIERYSHVMHIVSNVIARLRKDCTPLEALFAGFPAGTVSGAPKIRAMQIISELEPEKREIYAGCIGYLGGDGSLDTCIALRTAVMCNGAIHVQAGAGIVADSDPEKEYQECYNKAAALIHAANSALSREADKRN